MADETYKKHVYVLILAGGGGTRLWPRSRKGSPKQFLKLFKGKTLMQMTAERFESILPWERIYCVTVSEAYKEEILKEVPQFLPENIVVEPAKKDTAPAHGIGATYIKKRDKDAVIITEAADRVVEPVKHYLETLTAAAQVAYEKKLFVSVGVRPRYPHTGLGYIKSGDKEAVVGGYTFYKVEEFVEKPELALAQKFTSSGDYYWNAGQFVWRADTFLSELAKNEPKVGSALKNIEKTIGTSMEMSTVKKEYEGLPEKTVNGKPMAIDYAVAEKSKNMVVVGGDFFWTDIGDWKEVWQNLPKDHQGNVLIDGDEEGGEIINIDTSDALIHKNGRLIAVVDVDNLIIIDTKDALLITTKSRAQSVKKIVEKLKKEGRNELL